jgi:two-component system response regulator QseB
MSTLIEAPPGAPQFASDAPRGRVLVVQDDSATRQDLKICLEAVGYQVTGVFGHIATLAYIRTGAFDAVVTDAQLKGGRAFEVISFARRRLGGHAPVLVLSGLKHERSERKAVQFGASACLSKPVEGQEVAGTLNDLMDRRLSATA